MSITLLSGHNICQSFRDAEQKVDILSHINIQVFEQETLAILGASGSGKSTLLHILSTLDIPTAGEVMYKDKDLLKLNAKEQARFRNQELGFVYQFHHLLPEFNATENVAMPQLILGQSKKSAHSKAAAMLERVGLSHRLSHKPYQMSGGERQRVAIARAMINDPSIIMADEPTGNLDNESSRDILELIKQINHEEKTSFVIVTHDHELAKQLDRTLTLVNGKFVE